MVRTGKAQWRSLLLPPACKRINCSSLVYLWCLVSAMCFFDLVILATLRRSTSATTCTWPATVWTTQAADWATVSKLQYLSWAKTECVLNTGELELNDLGYVLQMAGCYMATDTIITKAWLNLDAILHCSGSIRQR